MKLVVIESPLRGQVPTWIPRFLAPVVERWLRARNQRYAVRCCRDALMRGEASYASHVHYDRPGLLNDAIPHQRELGIQAGFAWGKAGHVRAFYLDYGTSEGMQRGMQECARLGQAYVQRRIGRSWGDFAWERVVWTALVACLLVQWAAEVLAR